MKTIIKMEFGSKVYGTSVPESDTDFKGIFIPDAKSLILQKAKRNINQSTGNDKSKNTKDDVDIELFSFAEYIKLLLQGQTGALDMLFTPKEFWLNQSENLGPWYDLQFNYDKFLHSGTSIINLCI